MYLLLAQLFQLSGFYFLYQTSERIVLPKGKLSGILQRHTKITRYSAWVLLILSLYFFTQSMGIGAGILTGCITLMTCGSLVVILAPILLKNVKNAGK